ncbi:pectinesterase-like [Typha angustifolia]|uniref:pectinesterase-like n=1 Tax=Typha angustifolia TaxID=59011 RepID=UPI003C2D768E
MTHLANRRNTLLFSLLLLLLLLLVAIAATISSLSAAARSHAVLRSTCAAARFPGLCLSSISSSPSHLASISNPTDVIHASLSLALSAIHRSALHVRQLSASRRNLTARESTALADCLEMFDSSLDELRHADAGLREGNTRYSVADVEILVSAAMTNQESCADGFSHDSADRGVRAGIADGLDHVTHMCGNALAMIRNMTTNSSAEGVALKTARRLVGFPVDKEGLPEWMAKGDRRKLVGPTEEVEADAVVAADGSGDYATVQEAVDAAPAKSKKRWVIRIKAGVYQENVEVSKKKKNIMFIGDGRSDTVITGNRNVVDGYTTFKSATLAVSGDGFLGRGLRIENTAGPSKHQAVALRVGSDLSAFYDCDIVGYQDTLYLHSLRQFFRGCLIQGTVDFVFGNAAAVLQDCDLQARLPGPNQKNMITAQGRNDPDEPTGISIHKSRITAASDLAPVVGSVRTYLGRPWKEYSRTVVMESEISDAVNPDGWHVWDGEFGLDTLYYGEYMNTGPGSGTDQRVGWKGFKVITSATEAEQFTADNFIQGSGWLDNTGIPFDLGLSE